MAKDSAQSKIPRLGGATRIPAALSATIRIPTASAHHHHLHHQKAQLISGNNNKIVRPSTFTGLCPSVTTMASIKKSLSGDRITEAACIVGKKANANVKKFLTKPEKLSHNVVGDVTTVKMLNRDETIILDKGMKDDANQKLMITGGGILNQQQQQQQQQGNQNYFNTSETTTDNILNVTRTLTKSETFIRDKNNDDDGSTHNKNISADDEHSNEDDLNNTIVPFVEKQEQIQYQEQHQQQMQSSEIRHFDLNNIVFDKNTSDSSLSKTRTIEMTPILNNITVTLETNSKLHCNMADNYSNERLSDISIPSCDLDVTIQQNKDGVERFENEDEGHDEKIDTFENLNSALTLAPDKDEFDKVLNSTVSTERLLDITSSKSPSYQLMNLTRELSESQNYEQNNTKLLYMTTNEMTSPVLGSKYTPEHHSETTSIDEQMEIDEPQKSEENIFDIPANMNQVLSSQVIQELKQNKPRYSFGLDLTECTLDCSIDLCDVSLSSSTAQITSPSLKKQNSFEMDESLGILTPNQMKEFLDSTATTTNLDLPINIQQTGNKLVLHQMRIDQTPSPEDLPLDPVGVKTDITDVIMMQPPTAPVQNLITYQEISQTDSDSKTDQMTKSTASKVSNSFITSVTSITSLDTGYQGDGEMSRPASRGPADHSPSNGPRKPHLGRQPSFNHHNPPNIPIRRQDPMTDSDFFTESDADDIFHRGDRRAQVIDGQLYGPMLQPANVFISEQPQMEDSCMESSGIFTDVENRCDDELSRSRREADIDMSPDSSTDTIKSNNADYSNDSGNNNNNNTQIQLQRSLSPMSQSNSNSNILTDSQTSSTIQSSLSSDRISGCSVANDCSVIVQQQLKRNVNINGDVLISNSSKSLSNSSSIGALNINLNNSQNDDNDKTSLISQIHGTATAITTEVIGIASTSTVQQAPTSQPSTSLSPLVKKLSPSRKQQSHNIVGGKYESKANVNVNDNVTKTGGDSINTKSTNIGGNVKKSINSDQCDKINNPGVNNSDDNISAGDGDNRSMLEKSSARKGVNNSIGNQENKRPGSIVVTSPIATVANNVVSVSQTSPTPRKVMVNKWDAVMNKIAENKTTYKKNYSEVKSKVACGVLKRGTKTDANKSPISGKQSQINSNCGSLNSINGLSSPKTPSGKRVTQCATKRGRSYSKDSQQSSQSDLSLTGGSPKIHTKSGGNSRSAKKRDVRTLTISPTDLGPPPKSQTNSSSRAKQTPQILLQKRLSPNNLQQLSSSLSISNKNSPPSAKKVITRRPQAQQKPQQSHTKTPLKDHNRLINQTQSQQQQHQQQQLNHLNGSPKIAGNVIKGISPSNTTPNTPLQQVTGNCLKSSHTTPIATSPILNDNSVINAPSSILHSVQSHKKHLQHLQQQQQQQQQQKEQKTCKEAALELHLAHANKSVEALGVLLQYLTYDLDAFTCPSLKKNYANTQKNLIETRLLLEEAKSSCHELQDQLQDKDAYYIARESEIQALHRCELNKVESSLIEFESNAKDRIAALENQLAAKDADYEKKLQEYNKINEEKFANYEKQVQVAKEKEQELLKRINVLSTTENELRDKIQATENSFADRLRLAGIRERELTEKINSLNKQLDELRQKKVNCEREFEDKLNLYHDEISVLRLSKSSIDQISSPRNGATINGDVSLTGANRVQMLQNEVESLRSVLELKQAEVSELRIKNQEMRRAADELPAMQMKVSALESRIEDLQIQLKARAEEEKELIQKNKHLQESLSHEIQNRTRLSLHNEELQWRLKQNSKKFALTLAEFSKNSNQDNAGSLNSSISRTSINSQENLYLSHNSSLLSSTRVNGSERSMIGCFEMDDVSPPASPIIKGVVEKNDSVSWVLEMDDESPEVVASRMVRRAGSFRSSFNEKSPGGSKRHDLFLGPNIIINPLTQSASATSVLRQHSNESMCETPRQANSRIRSKSVTIKSPEQKKIARQSSISGTSSSRKSEPPLSSSWKDPIYCSSPYTRRSSSSRSPPKDVSPHLLLGVVSSTSSSSSSTLTSTKTRERTDSFNTDTDNGLFNQKHEPNLITCDTSALASAAERIEMRSLPTHPSVQDLKNLKKCQEIQESAGEAMVSGTNSEDEGCSASSDEAVSSNSSTTTSSLGTGKQHNIDCILIEKINCSLGGTPMEVSWSDDGDQFPSESVV